MSFIKSIKNAFGGSDSDEYDVFGQPTSFVNPFSKDKNVRDNEHEKEKEDVQIIVNQQEEYAIDAEFADKAARLMNEHTQAVIDMLKGNWKKEREELLKTVEDAKKIVDENKEKLQAGEANRRQAVTRANEMSAKIAELEADYEKLDIEKKSLESRLKAMEVRGDNTDDLNQKIEELNKEIEELSQKLQDSEAEIERRDKLEAEYQGPTVEQLNEQLEQREQTIEQLRETIAEKEEQLNAAAEDIKAAEELQKTIDQVEEFQEKQNAKMAAMKQQIADFQQLATEFDETRKANIVLKEEKEELQRTIEQLEATAKQNADVQNRRSIETGNIIDGLKQQLATANATAEDFKRRFNSLSADGNEKQANFARITAERDDAKAELKRTLVTLSKKQHEAQAMNDAIAEKDRRIASLTQEIEALKAASPQKPAAAPYVAYDDAPLVKEDSAMGAIDDIDWADDGSMPPHPGEDPRQLSLF